MPANGTETAVLSLPPDAVLATVRKVIDSKRYKVVEESAEQITFITRKTLLNWELDGTAAVAAAEGGTQLSITLQSRSDRPNAMMDGVKNSKAAQKLLHEISSIR